MTKFKTEWEPYKVAPFKQVSTVGLTNGVFPSSHEGACNTIVMDWFRRIQKGRPTWGAHRDKESGKIVPREEISREKLDKKALRWDALQRDSKFSEDPRFAAPRPGGIEAGTAGGSEVFFSKKVSGDLKDVGSKAIVAMWENRNKSTEMNRFFLLSLRASDGSGHSIGLHALPVVNEDQPGKSSSTESLVDVSNPRLSIPPNHLHMFDPNHSEWVVPKKDSERFAGEFLEFYYGPPQSSLASFASSLLQRPTIKSVSVTYIPVWWKTD